MVAGMIGKIEASTHLSHRLTKGELRELFLCDLLSPFLTAQFDVGTGIIINQRGDQSRQTDIILYDKRILPPFIQERHLGVYPAESVVATIEVKTTITKAEVLKAEQSARLLHEKVYAKEAGIYQDYDRIRPLCGLIGCYGRGLQELHQQGGVPWLESNITHIFAICLLGKCSWCKLAKKGWTQSLKTQHFEETKRFIAIFIDNVRTHAELRLQWMSQFSHKDWLSAYIRDQGFFD
jgi:hypothetical protein